MAKQCASPPKIPFAVIAVPDRPYDLNESFRFACKPGYVALSNQATCLWKNHTATWKYTACKPRNCGMPDLLKNGWVVGNVFLFPHHVTYGCDEPYRFPHGRKTVDVRCDEDGKWTPSPASLACQPKQCPELPAIDHGTVTYSVWNVERLPLSEARYACDPHYKLVGQAFRSCRPDCTWEGSAPVCERITCAAPGHALPPTDLFYVNDTVSLQCDGRRFRSTCLETGSWSEDWGTCDAIDRPVVNPRVDPRKGYAVPRKRKELPLFLLIGTLLLFIFAMLVTSRRGSSHLTRFR